MRVDFFKEIPGLSEAVKRETDARDAAFLDLTTGICGVQIRQMTPEDLLILDGLDNPMVQGGPILPNKLAEFLWRMSPQSTKPFHTIRRFFFYQLVRMKNYHKSVESVRKYIEVTFQDSPSGGSGGKVRPYAGWLAQMVSHLAREFGWSEKQILRTPLRRLFQYEKCIIRWNDPEAPMINPSDRLVSRWTAQFQRKMHQYLIDLNTQTPREFPRFEYWDYN